MKIKKKLALIMAATISMFTIAGCSTENMSYLKETQNLAKWEATASNFTGEINIEANGTTQKMGMTGTCYAKQQNQAYMEFKITSTDQSMVFPELKMYVDNGIVYMNKDYYINNFTMNGMAAPAGLVNINSEYIGINSGMDMKELAAISTSPDYVTEFTKKILGDTNIDVPMTQNGREYSINMDTDSMLSLISKVATGVTKNIENVNSEFKLGLDANAINEIKNSKNIEESIVSGKDFIDGSSISIKDTFTDNSYKSDMNLNLQIKDAAKINMKLNATSEKAAIKDIAIPTNSLVLTQEQLMNLMAPEEVAQQAIAQ